MRVRIASWLVALGAAGALAGAGCGEQADLQAGEAISGSLDGNDLNETALRESFGIDVADIEAALAATKNGPRLLSDTNRRYDVWTLRVRSGERVVLRAASTIMNPVLAVADMSGGVLGANDDGNPSVPSIEDAWLVVDNPVSATAIVLVVVTEFGGPIGGGYLLEVNLD
jgi:hypothetical protein